MRIEAAHLSAWAPKLTRALVYASALLTAWNLAQLTWLALPARTTSAPKLARAAQVISGDAYQALVQRIIDAHLFGSPNPQDNVQALPETRLALVLSGTYTLGGGRGYAIIAPAKGQQAKVYAAGDELPGKVELSRVLDRRVLLRTAHGEETLKMAKSYGGGTTLVQTPAGNPASQLESLRRQLLTNPMALQRYVYAIAVKDNGKIKGFRVAPRGNPALFNSLGLHSGDVVTAINGVPLGDPQRLAGLFAKLHATTQITLAVERNGRQVTIARSLR